MPCVDGLAGAVKGAGWWKARLITWLEVNAGFELNISKCSQEVKISRYQWLLQGSCKLPVNDFE